MEEKKYPQYEWEPEMAAEPLGTSVTYTRQDVAIDALIPGVPHTKEEALESIDESERDIENGKFISSKDLFAELRQKYGVLAD